MDRAIAKPRFRHARMIGAAAAILLGAGAAGLYVFRPAAAARTYRMSAGHLTISTVVHGEFEDFVPIRGRVAPLRSIYLDAVEGGRVEAIHVEEGAVVAAGDLLVTLSNMALQLEVLAREADVAAQLGNLRQTELDLEGRRLGLRRELVDVEYHVVRLARRLARQRQLAAAGAISRAELEEAGDEHDYLLRKRAVLVEAHDGTARMQRLQLAKLRESTAMLEQNLALTRRNLDFLTIRAPVAGKLTALQIDLGQSVGRGQRIGQIDTGGFKITAAVDQFYAARVAIGQPAALVSDGGEVVLRVAKTYPEVREGRFDVDLLFENAPPPGLRRGQSLPLRLQLGDSAPAVMIPNGSFYQETGGHWIFVVAGDAAVRRPVTLGRRNARYIEVIDGLDPGEKVITSPYSSFADMERLELTM